MSASGSPIVASSQSKIALSRVAGVHDVAQAVVAVHDRGRAGLGDVRAQPARDLVDRRQLARGVVLPQAGEAPHLALEVARRLAEALQAARLPVDGVDLHERVDQLVADPLRLHPGGQLVAEHDPLDALHHVEGDAEQGLVLAGREDLRDTDGGGLERAQQARLAQDVVRGGRERRPRRAPQDPFAAVAADQVRDVGVPVADRLRLQFAAPQTVVVEELLERASNQQRRSVECRGFFMGIHDRDQATIVNCQ